MRITDIIAALEDWAPLSLQESYDNAGLITGDRNSECSGVMVSLDATESVVLEAVSRGCNLVVSHHPILFSGLKKLSGGTYVERAVIAAIKNDVSLYAIHTNLDNVSTGVNAAIAAKLGLKNTRVLAPKQNTLLKLYTFAPEAAAPRVRTALFEAGAGVISDYDRCSFNTSGTGTFRAGEGANPFVGKIGEEHHEAEVRIEVVLPASRESAVLAALKEAHPYEEVAYDLVALTNTHPGIGSGLIGELEVAMETQSFLAMLKAAFGLQVVRFSGGEARDVKSVAVCGGAGSFLIKNALREGADAYVTSDVKYHEFFDADGRMLLADIGHFESEQFTVDMLARVLQQKFPTFATLKTTVVTNPVRYFIG
jgi:dinuclear metal center YbgI/SA1388 family protein